MDKEAIYILTYYAISKTHDIKFSECLVGLEVLLSKIMEGSLQKTRQDTQIQVNIANPVEISGRTAGQYRLATKMIKRFSMTADCYFKTVKERDALK